MSLINLAHLCKATGYSLAGLKRAWSQEQAFKHEVLLLPVIILLLLLIRPGALWSALLLGGWFMVMSVELLNSAIEEAFDLVEPEFNMHVKYGKDMASAAIFMMLCVNGLLWLAMFWNVFV